MKINMPLTGVEQTFDADKEIVSTTDLKGIITYANETFMEVCGFSEQELLKKNHNIVRHPDMPPEGFADLWSTLKAGKAWMGIVKNRAKNGDHYWVDAFVTPMYDGDRVVGYESVRVRPKKEYVERAEKLYQAVREKRLKLGLQLSFAKRLFLAQAAMLIGALVPVSGSAVPALQLVVGVALGLTVAWFTSQRLARPLQEAAQTSKGVIDNLIARLVYGGANTEVAQLKTAICMLEARLRTVVGRYRDTSRHLGGLAEETSRTAEQNHNSLTSERAEIESVAAALEEMEASVHEVTHNAAEAARVAGEVKQAALSGKHMVTETSRAISAVAEDIQRVADAVRHLEQESKNISRVVQVIHAIAEQTNLLALNAAIEAARAGEHGRGFAVVADEVRKLAMNTQDSTQDIDRTVERLQLGAQNAVRVMEEGCLQANDCVRQAEDAGRSLAEITEAISRISDMNMEIACAVEQQSAATKEINRNVGGINHAVEQMTEEANRTLTTSRDLVKLGNSLSDMARRFAA